LESSNSGNIGGGNKSNNHQKKTLAEKFYYIGSVKQASNFTLAMNFILNQIKKTFTNGDYNGYALEECEEMDFTKLMPTMHQFTSTDKAIEEFENKQYVILYKAEIQVFKAQEHL